ncbi:putative powdery mildew resistance protein, RPW8 [Rosa chinensis]|uniref:Putative powdery mildew resistance protein, RPW8 n=1 Tax=Rosa chinensis TaxID=74649 RepID=A0A2P6PFH4_ROSCH|nr:putative powdery mildew resistance protein, RPW8 [Rosa chinensis]
MTFSFYWVCVQEDSKEKRKKKKMIMFKVHVRDVKLTLECLKPVIQEISEYNKLLNNLPMEEELALQDLKLQMEAGANLVRKCSKVGAWSFCKKYKYSNQLFQLDQSLQTLLHLLEVQKTRDVQETLVSVKNIETVVQRIEANISAMQINQSAAY